MTVLGSLDAALAALNDRKHEAALERLVQAWRTQPVAELAQAIAVLGARVDLDQPPLGGSRPVERETLWQARAKENRASQLGVLLATVADTKGSDQTRDRLHLLLTNGPDPRLTDRIAQMLLVPPYNGSVSRTAPFWKLLFEWLPKLGDPRVVELVEKLPAAWKAKELSDHEREGLDKRLQKVRPLIAAAYRAVPPLGPAEASVLAKISQAISDSTQRAATAAAPGKKSREELLRAVYESPGEDAPRLVFADFLLEQGDPRGELITLQFKKRDGNLTREQAAREKELLAAHGRSWLGAIEKQVNKTGMEFERGFLSACKATQVDASPEWSTVRELECSSFADGDLRLASLVTLRGHPASLDRLPQVRRLISRGPWGRSTIDYTHLSVEERQRWSVPRPQIESLELDGDDVWCSPAMTLDNFEWLRAAFPKLRELSLPFPSSRLDEWRRFGDVLELERLVLRMHPSQRGAFVLTFTRAAGGKLSQLHLAGQPKDFRYFGMVNPPSEPGGEGALLAALSSLAPDALTAFETGWKAPPELTAALSKQTRLAQTRGK